MPMLTPDLIANFPLFHYVDFKTIQRGQQYYRAGRVFDIEYFEDYAVCQVEGSYDDYEVLISVDSKRKLQMSCTCPQAEVAPVCKHMVAALLALKEYLTSGEIQKGWQYKLGLALQIPPPQKPGSRPRNYAAIFFLNDGGYYGQYVFSLLPYIIKASSWKDLDQYAHLDAVSINELLDKDRRWTRAMDSPYQNLNPAGCLNVSPAGIAFFNFVIQYSRYYGQMAHFATYLPMLAQLDIPIFLREARGDDIKQRLWIHNEPATVQAAMTRSGEKLILQAGIELGNQIYTSGKENLQLVSHDPPWILAGHKLLPVANPESLGILPLFPFEIPATDEDIFRSKYFRQIAERMPVQGDVITWEEVSAIPIPRLYLRNEKGTLRADLRYGYGDFEVLAERDPAPVTLEDKADAWTFVRIYRQPERELSFYQMLTDAKYGLKRAGNGFPFGTFELRARTHPYDFLTQSIPALTEAGFEIFGDRDSLGKVNRNKPTIWLNVTSGIDWFELDAIVRYGDQEIKLREIHKALKKGNRYIKLADGSIGQIPEEWLERYKHLFAMAEETEGGLRVSDLQLSLVDELLADAEKQNIVPEFHQKRERLKHLSGLQPQPLPQGFMGELFPYQKAGFDWLHFLREHGFGGILADDMGLGKTIQVLALLQSQREQNPALPPALLVVPKSLIANWQRESARFTPGLRILEYLGNSRKKETEIFKEYDIVLTTYGTLLRDIESLRQYRFSYAILDESQAIKNPVSQSARAVRLINAEHRLAMTGTPVENNAFELWSQFAFVNPGLLGNMDYFRREFARPIESRSDDATVALLKRLVYPFILRRTKEQVAPELPPRTERIIFTDLEPAQRKLYEQTRDLYRGQLLGLIDKGSLDNARMKILEGLLRLRQICIHPALVQPAYKKQAAKFKILLETLETLHAEGHKALVFSQFVQTLKLLEGEMRKMGLPYLYLDGQTRDRQARVDLFQRDPAVFFFLISLKAGGVGLNLTAADYVLHLDPWWNPAVEMQAADRAHRIGQDKPVFIYKFIARETVEEKILELQSRKRNLVEQLISAEGSIFKSLTPEDVQVLFS